jgi:uncharacterized membrane protein YeaQ/YmgE (transglycosylase-associated protein family)
MSATEPIVTFVMILVIGIVAGILFDRLAGPSWLTRQFTGSTRGIVTSALVGIAGAFVGYHIAVLLALGGGLLMSVIASAAGAAVVLFAWRLLAEAINRIGIPLLQGGRNHRASPTTPVAAQDLGH